MSGFQRLLLAVRRCLAHPLAPRLVGFRLEGFQLARRLAHGPEAALLLDQIPGIAELNDFAFIQDEHLVVVDDCLQAVGDCNGGVFDLADRLLNLGIL